MSLVAPYNVVNDIKNHDVHSYKKITGTFDFADDRLAGKKWWAAVRGSANAHGYIAADAGVITGFTVTAGGTGYTSAPTVTIAGGIGTGATATATVANGAVTAVTLGVAGSGYISAPTVAFSGGGGTGASATVAFTAGKAHVDAAAAKAVPGVKGVFWYENTNTLVSNWTYYGAPIAAVCAEDWETARYAAGLIKIEQVAQAVIFDADAAMAPNAPLSGRNATANYTTSTFTRGDVTAGFAAADVTINVEDYWSPTQQHNPVTPKQGLAYWIGDDVYGYCHLQSGVGGRAGLASATAAPLQKTHVQIHGVGGGFGDGTSNGQMNLAGQISQQLNGHAVTVKLSRQGHNQQGSRQYDTKSKFKIGAKKDGTLVAWSGDWYANGGAASGMWYGARTTWVLPNVSWTGWGILTNTPGRAPWRCVLDQGGAYCMDSALDKLAQQLNMDPYQLRLKNLQAADQKDQDTPFRYWATKGITKCFPVVATASNYAAKWHAPGTKTLPDGRLHGISITGHQDSHGGISGAGRWGHIRMGGQDNTGLCMVYGSGANASTGPQSMAMHVVAEVLGLKYSDVGFGEWANSDINFDTGGQNGSGHTGGAGSAYYNTALQMRERLFARASLMAPFSTIVPAGVTKAVATASFAGGVITGFTVTSGGAGYTKAPAVTITGGGGNSAAAVATVVGGVVTNIAVTNPGVGYNVAPTVNIATVTSDLMDAKNSTVFLISDPTKVLTHAQIVSGWDPQIIVANGWAAYFKNGTVGDAKIGDLCNQTGSAATCVEVAVDTDTGEVEVTGIWNAVDVGTTLNAVSISKEMDTGVEEIMKQVLFLGDIYDPSTAAVISMAHGMAFGHPTSLDFTGEAWKWYDVQTNNPAGPLGAHGMAEPALTNASAVLCAIFNATGKWMDWKHGAGTPDKVLTALGKG